MRSTIKSRLYRLFCPFQKLWGAKSLRPSMCLYNLIMDHDAPILPILFTQFRTSFSRTSGREHRSALSFHLSMSRRPSCLKYALAVCTNPAPCTSAREHRSASLFYLSMSRRPSPPAVPHVRYKRAVLPCLCSPGIRLARPAKRTDTRSAHFSLFFLYLSSASVFEVICSK